MKTQTVPGPARRPTPRRKAIREDIVRAAADLFQRRGYNGVSFLHIAKELGIAHSGIHYYFKTKDALAECVLATYCHETLEHYRNVWHASNTTLLEKCLLIRNWIYERYMKYNPDGRGAKVWGLLTRFSMDADLMPSTIKTMIRETESQIEMLVRDGVETAVRSGELKAGAPVNEITIQLSTILMMSMQVTRYAGNFQRFDDWLRWSCETIQLGYGTSAALQPWQSPPDIFAQLAKGDGRLRSEPN